MPNIMRSRSAKLRLRHTIQVGAITDEEEFKYLTCMCLKASEEDVQKAVDLFGGCFIRLTYAASALDSGEAGLAILITTFQRYRDKYYKVTSQSERSSDGCSAQYCAVTN